VAEEEVREEIVLPPPVLVDLVVVQE